MPMRKYKCNHNNECNNPALFNYAHCKNGISCDIHKKSSMISIINHLCDQCARVATYGYYATNTHSLQRSIHTIKCIDHKLDDMSAHKYKICHEKLCNLSPSFNYPGEKQFLYCATHKKVNMINLKIKRCVICKKNANYGLIINNKIRMSHCFLCKTDKMLSKIKYKNKL